MNFVAGLKSRTQASGNDFRVLREQGVEVVNCDSGWHGGAGGRSGRICRDGAGHSTEGEDTARLIVLDGPERPNTTAPRQGQEAKGCKPLSGLGPRQ